MSDAVLHYPEGSPKNLLLGYQRRYVEDKSRFKMAIMSRQTGKDFSSGCEGVEDCKLNPKTDWLIGAPGERQALESLGKWKDWAEAFDLAIDDYQEDRPGGSETLINSATITFPNGSRAIAIPGKPSTVRGYSANILLTEFAFFEQPDETWRAMLPSITNPLRGLKKVRLITTPNGKGNKTDELWHLEDAGRRMKWARHKVTIWDAVKDGLMTTADAEDLKEALNDPIGWAQEFECEFLDGSNVLLPYDLIAYAESIEATEAIGADFFAQTRNPVFCGVDFGRSNDPTICWTLELVADTLWTREVLELKNVSSPDQEKILSERIKRSVRTSFDYTGPGIGLGDYLVNNPSFGLYHPESHSFGKVDLVTFTPASKREMFPKLRRKFEPPTKLRVPISRVVREDLHAMQQIVTNGEYNYWAPRTRDGHSDRCTALALAVRAAGDGVPAGTIKAFHRGGDRTVARRNREVIG
jgi:phage FluMu gp28-like protein